MNQNYKEFIEKMEKEFIEEGAELEHSRWSRWYLWQKYNSTEENLIRWYWQSTTPYSVLRESEKESDRKETRNYLPFLHEVLSSQLEFILEFIKENMPKVITPTIEPPPNRLSQNQIFAGGQTNMAIRVIELLNEMIKEK